MESVLQKPLHHRMKHGGLCVARKQDTNSACSGLMRPARGGFSVLPGLTHQQDVSNTGVQLHEVLFVLYGETFHPPCNHSILPGNDIVDRGMERWMVQKAALQQRV